jgi:toxin-antitoxin system PIN domain toxin
MSGYLLDVNVLVALVDPAHVEHEPAHEWFARLGQKSWATSPITENGLIRIVGNPRYPNSPGTPAAVASILRELRALPGHSFWADDVTLLDPERVDCTKILDHSQVTDCYLLALAVAHDAELATFDRRMVVDPVTGGRKALHLI